MFAAAPIEDQPERLSPFGCSTFSESTGGGTAAAAAAELASLTGESIAEAVETALQERLKRYRFRNVEIAERLARLAQEVALLGRIDRAPATGQEPPPDEFRASELHCRPVHRTGRQTTDLRA